MESTSNSAWLYQYHGIPWCLMIKNPPANAGDTDLIPESGRFPGEGHDNQLQCSCLKNPMDTGAQWAIVHGVTQESATT